MANEMERGDQSQWQHEQRQMQQPAQQQGFKDQGSEKQTQQRQGVQTQERGLNQENAQTQGRQQNQGGLSNERQFGEEEILRAGQKVPASGEYEVVDENGNVTDYDVLTLDEGETFPTIQEGRLCFRLKDTLADTIGGLENEDSTRIQ